MPSKREDLEPMLSMSEWLVFISLGTVMGLLYGVVLWFILEILNDIDGEAGVW